MAQFCYITTCKGRLAHLQQSLPRIASQPGADCVVVDYDCPDGAADWVTEHFPELRVVRVSGEPHFHLARARNLGAAVSEAAWLGFFDADILLAPDFVARVLPLLEAGSFYRAHPHTDQTWGSLICRREDFEAVGGYDELYQGWGGEDDDLVAMLTRIGRRQAHFPGALLAEIAHDDELRTRYHDIKDMRLQRRINICYQFAKMDIARLMGSLPAPETLRALYAEVQRTVLAAGADEGVSLEISLPPRRATPRPEERRLDLKLHYTLSKPLP